MSLIWELITISAFVAEQIELQRMDQKNKPWDKKFLLL